MAEVLKTRLCDELDKEVQAKGWTLDLSTVRVSLPPQLIHTSRRDVYLGDLTIDARTFSDMVRPFLDPEGTNDKEGEHYSITSIFTPIRDALGKAGLEPDDITRVLLVGGSSRNPLVEHAIKKYFREATIERERDLDTLVAEGAAVQAYWQFIVGHNVLAPIVGDTIGLLIDGDGFKPLINAGSPIPYPSEGRGLEVTDLRVPRDGMSGVDLVICAGSKQRPVHSVRLRFDVPVPVDTPIQLRVRLDSQKIFHLEALLAGHPNVHVTERIDNPLALRALTPREADRLHLEAVIAKAYASGTQANYINEIVQLARTMNALQRFDPALDMINRAMSLYADAPTPEMKHIQAYALDKLGKQQEAHDIWLALAGVGARWAWWWAVNSAPDLPSEEKCVRAWIEVYPADGAAHYHLASMRLRIGEEEEAIESLLTARKHLEAAVKRRRSDRGLLWYLVSVYDELGQDDEEAAKIRERYRQLSDSSASGRNWELPSLSPQAGDDYGGYLPEE